MTVATAIIHADARGNKDHCRHVEALSALLEAGKLTSDKPATTPTVKPAIPHDWQRGEAPIV